MSILKTRKNNYDFSGNNLYHLQRNTSAISAEETGVCPETCMFSYYFLPHLQILFLGQNNPKAIQDVVLSRVTRRLSACVGVWRCRLLDTFADIDAEGITGLSDR